MNTDTAKQYLPFVQALADGKTIQQLQDDGSWQDEIDLWLGFHPDHYRIKPEPAEVKIWCTPNNEPVSITTHSDVGQTYSGQTVKLFREVI